VAAAKGAQYLAQAMGCYLERSDRGRRVVTDPFAEMSLDANERRFFSWRTLRIALKARRPSYLRGFGFHGSPVADKSLSRHEDVPLRPSYRTVKAYPQAVYFRFVPFIWNDEMWNERRVRRRLRLLNLSSVAAPKK
jgi:hypothetical protein